jgi:uncharacterized protein (DUF58 family)
MTIYPTSTGIHMAVVALLGCAVGLLLRAAPVVAWCGAMMLGLALARAVTLLSVARIRTAGFEMLWSTPGRVVQLPRGATIVLDGEIRNRDSLAARFDRLRVLASPELEVEVDVPAGEVPAGGSVAVKVRVRALRVGHHGIHSLALELRGAPGLFEVPLTFANPFGVQVIPARSGKRLRLPPGGGRGSVAATGRAGRARGEGIEFRELREHVPGDPFRRIAWKASARRGKLVVRQLDREQRDDVWLVLDASVEHWAGPPGRAPLDAAIESVAGLARRHLAAGDRVGLFIIAGRELASLPPDRGPRHYGQLVAALIHRTSVRDADRCAWDEGELAREVAEHIRALDPRAALHHRHGQMDRMLRRVSRVLKSRAPFGAPVPYGRSAADECLRHYAACFGMALPVRSEPDAARCLPLLEECLSRMARTARRREGIVHVFAPAPRDEGWRILTPALRRLRARGLALRWSFHPVPRIADEASGREAIIGHAVLEREAIAERAARVRLRSLGVVLVHGAGRGGMAFGGRHHDAAASEERVA